MSKQKTHMDNTQADAAMRMALCGWPTNETTTHIDEVTCKSCIALMRARGTRRIDHSAAQARLVEAFKASSLPSASSPPVLNASVWPATCKGGEQRCHECVLCEWEREAERWSVLSIWSSHKERSARPAGAPSWPSLSAALAAMVEFDLHGRAPPSAFSGILACIARGYMESGPSKGDDPLLARAGDFVRVRKALALAYPEGSPWGLSSLECKCILLARTPGALGQAVRPMPYETMSAELGVSEGTLKAVVKRGRQVVSIELAARGLIPEPPTAAGMFEQIAQLRERLVAHG